jgi:coenzyme F420-0:L-glutamate ligase/coenzyme F420-1:gamma-L-glutamate ligase
MALHAAAIMVPAKAYRMNVLVILFHSFDKRGYHKRADWRARNRGWRTFLVRNYMRSTRQPPFRHRQPTHEGVDPHAIIVGLKRRIRLTGSASHHRDAHGPEDEARWRMIEIVPLGGISEILPGDDLPAILAQALASQGLVHRSGDVLVVTQKIVSKSEGRFVRLDDIVPGAEAERLAAITRKDPRLVELVLAESTAIVRAIPHVLITRHRLGLVMANAGIDRSNIGPGEAERALLLPVDPDASAARIAAALDGPAVIISDSFGRPWRYGVVSVAIGASGLPSLIDRRGDLDRDGRPLEVTQIALADMIATAAGLAAGEGAESIPAVLVRGYAFTDVDAPASALVRPLTEDLFQ